MCTAERRQDRFLCVYGQIKWEGEEERRARGIDERERSGREKGEMMEGNGINTERGGE